MKRTSLLRRTPLQRVGSLPRQAIRRVRSLTGPSPAVRALVVHRDCGKCVVCAATGEQVHHRQARSLGGSSDPAINSPVNLILVCARHHRDIESWRTSAEKCGYLVRRPKNPADVPVIVHGQGWMQLLASGKREPVHHDGN